MARLLSMVHHNTYDLFLKVPFYNKGNLYVIRY